MELPPSRHWLLPFHRSILHRLLPDDEELRDLLVILAPGLGLRRVVSTLLRVYTRPQSLVVVVNASAQDVKGINHDLGTLGLGHNAIRDVHHHMSSKQRTDLYLSSGIISVTSRILVVDMLQKRIPTSLLTGMVVLNAERVSPTSIEAFIVRLYREQNNDGFLKAFSDNAEHLASGYHKLQTIMSQLRLRQVDIWPRFQEEINHDLGQRRADVIELHQPLTPRMRSIQNAIIQCLEATLHQVKLSKLVTDLDDLNVEQAMYRAFDVTVRRHLDPVWHRLSPATRQLVGDLYTLRQLLHALLSYDSVSFYEYLETILASNAPTSEPGAPQRQSQWLMSDEANLIFHEARARLWQEKQDDEGMSFELEELPKWKLLAKVLDEVEQDIYRDDSSSSHTILIMVQSERTVAQLRTWLSLAEGNTASPGRPYLTACLHNYLAWKKSLLSFQKERHVRSNTPESPNPSSSIHEALRHKMMRTGAPAHKRRRMRGGMSQTSRPSLAEDNPFSELDHVAAAMDPPPALHGMDESKEEQDPGSTDFFGLLDLDHVIVVQSYQGDNNDNILQELRPGYVIMYDPNASFVRQVELYRATQSLSSELRIYFFLYVDSVEEQMYLGGLRREKDAFERLIREKATMVIPLTTNGLPAEEDADQRMVRMLSTRIAGGQRLVSGRRPRVVVDMREFRSSLPSFLHAAGMEVIPCTLQVGDYVISSDMCVERKTLTDLMQSLNSGRLYTQCEAMSMHYPYPILLIEFDQDRAFTWQSMGDVRSAHGRAQAARSTPSDLDVQSKLVLLTLTFPRLHIIWSSSPYASVEIFADLKQNYDDPDPERAASVGLDDSLQRQGQREASLNITPYEMLCSMPGVTLKNAAYLAQHIPNIQALCETPLSDLQSLIGAEAGRKLHQFLHRSLA